MFKERKTKLTLLSLLSALVVISTASMGMIYAQEVDDSELTTFEEEALKAEEEITATADDDDSSAYLSGQRVDDDSADDTETASETETADLDSLFAGLIVCDLGPVDASAPDETAIAALETLPTPTVSVTVMSETEVAEAVANETTTASANETQIASAECMNLGGDDDNATSTSSTADDMSNATLDAGDNATSTAGNATSATDGNATSSVNATSTSNATSTAGDEEIAVIEGQDFAPGEVVLVFSSNAIVTIDDVDESGDIEAKVPLSNVGNDISFVETGTQRSTEFNFDGQTLIAAEGQGEIQAEGTNQELDIAEILRNGTNAAEIEGQDEPGDANATDDSN